MAIDGTSITSGGNSTSSKPKRGKDQLPWGEEVWVAIDQAVNDEIMRSRMGSKFLPQVYVHKKKVNVDSDAVVLPTTASDQALSVDETQTTRIQEYWIQFKLSPAQMEAEGSYDAELTNPIASASTEHSGGNDSGAMSRPHRASTGVSLAQRAATFLAQAEDAVIFSGQNALQNHPLFASGLITFLDPTLPLTLDPGLLSISSDGKKTPTISIGLPSSQVVLVHPVVIGPTGTVPLYRESTLNALAQGVSVLQGLAHYEGYAATFHTAPFADLFQALPTTLIEPVMPARELVKLGIYGTGLVPPFVPLNFAALGVAPSGILPPAPSSPVTSTFNGTTVTLGANTGLPTVLAPGATSPNSSVTNKNSANTVITQSNSQLELLAAASASIINNSGIAIPATGATVLYTGILVGLTGNTMDLVRGQMDDGLDVSVTFNQKDQSEQYRFRAVQRLALRLKDPTSVILFLFLDC